MKLPRPALGLPLEIPASARDMIARLWREHIREHRGRIVSIIVLTVLMAAANALYPLLIDRAFTMFTRHDQRILYQIPFLAIAVTSAKAATQYFQGLELQRVVLRVIAGLQVRMFAHLTQADLARLERESPAVLTSRVVNDAMTIRESLTRTTNGMADAMTVLGLICTMLYLNWELCLVTALIYPLAILPIQKIGRRARKASGSLQKQAGQTAALLNESFAQARTIRAYRLEATENTRAAQAFADLQRGLFRIVRNRSRVAPILEMLGGIAVAMIIGFVGWRAAVGDDTLGQFMGFVSALLLASRPVQALGSLHAATQEGLAGLVRMFGMLDEKPSIAEAPDAKPLPAGRGELACATRRRRPSRCRGPRRPSWCRRSRMWRLRRPWWRRRADRRVGHCRGLYARRWPEAARADTRCLGWCHWGRRRRTRCGPLDCTSRRSRRRFDCSRRRRRRSRSRTRRPPRRSGPESSCTGP